jgi:hypothetical protein
MHSIYQRPQFEAAIGRSIALWSHVDSQVGQLFALLIGVESEATHRVYLLLRRWSNQRQSLEEAAKGSLSGDQHNVFLALMAEYSILEQQRNDLGHGVFGVCPDDETFLFMIKIEDHVLWRTFAPTLCDSATQSKRMRFSIHTTRLARCDVQEQLVIERENLRGRRRHSRQVSVGSWRAYGADLFSAGQ